MTETRSVTQSFAFRVVALTALLLLVWFGLQAFYTVTAARDAEQRALEQRAEAFAEVMSRSLRWPIWFLDRPQMQSVLEAAATDSDFRFARVVDERGQEGGVTGSPGDGVTIEKPVLHDGRTIGRLTLTLSTRGRDARIADAQRTALIGLGLSLVLVLAIMLVGMRSIFRPLGAMQRAMASISGGELAIDVPGAERRDEIGQMARAIVSFRDAAQEIELLRMEQIARDAAAERDRRQALLELADRLEAEVTGAVTRVSHASASMRSETQDLAAAAQDTQRESQTVASAADDASSNVNTVAAAAEELAASIEEISRRMAETTSIAAQASDEARLAADVVGSLASSAATIGAVVQLINQIAAQTNLLALNATIEAARAGDAGRGFAVVASEVKNLANQTAQATGDIARQVETIQSETTRVVTAIGNFRSTLDSVNQITTTVAAAVEQQGAATKEIARSAQTAASATTDVTSAIVRVRETVATTSSTIAEIARSADGLSSETTTLSGEVARFVERVRAG